MEISSTAGKSWQPSHEPPHRKGKQASVTVNKQWKEGEKGWGKLPDEELPLLTTLQVHAQSTCKNAPNEGQIAFDCIK